MTKLPKGWIKTKLGDVTTKIGSGATPTGGEQSYKVSGTPLIRSLNIHFDGVRDEGLAYIDESQAARLDNVIVQNGDVLLNITGASIGRVAVASSKYHGARVNQHVAIIRLVEEVLPIYVSDFLASPEAQDFITRENYGATRQALTKSILEEFSFPLAPLAEQKRIVVKLNTLKDKATRAYIELSRVESLADRYKQALLTKAFSGELTLDWRKGGSWPAPIRLEEVADSFAYGSAAKSKKSGSVPVLRMGNIQDGKLDWTDLVYTSNRTEIEKYRLNRGDVLFNRTNSPALVGKTALFNGEREAIFAGYLIRIAPRPNLLSAYLTYALNSPSGKSFSRSVKTDGVSQSNISATKLKNFSFTVPSIEEQHVIVDRIESALNRLTQLTAETKRAIFLLDRLKEAMLAKAFRGELIPQNESDEPADLLLKRALSKRKEAPKVQMKRTRRKNSMLTATDFLKSKLESWPAEGVSFSELRHEFDGNYEDLKDALFVLLTGEHPVLRQIFDDNTANMKIGRS